jgi:hypothetical protein
MNELSYIVTLFEQNQNQDNAIPMRKYMKEQFSLL